MESVRRNSGENYRRKALVCLITCGLLLIVSLSEAMALEAVDVTGSTGVLGTTWGDHTIIDTDHGAIIDWSNFDTTSGQSVKFNQFDGGILSDTSGVLNRITSAEATQFDGALIGNGRVFVVNPAGIVFGIGSTIDVTQLVASGLNMSNDAFNAVLADPANRMEFEGGDGNVTNYALVNADSVYLIGKNVRNVGVILAPDGLIVMAAGDNVYLGQDGSNIVVDVTDAEDDGISDVWNSSRLSAESGSIVLAASDTFGRAIVNNGIISAYGGGDGTIEMSAARIVNRGRIRVDGRHGSDAGSVTLSASEEIIFEPRTPGSQSMITAQGGTRDGLDNGNGGTIIIESEGSIDLGTDSLVSAIGGIEGDGGYIRISGENITIDPSCDIEASPQDLDYEVGTLEIEAPTITVANGADLGATNTLYEQDIEALSNTGTNVIARADSMVTVQDIADNVIQGSLGAIELHATDAAGLIAFDDTGDTISTTLGNIAMSAGSGGIIAGNLETGKDLSSNKPTAGSITLATANGGDITAENLIIRDGWGSAQITADASGDLTVNGDIIVGRDNSILNIPGGADAEAMINLSAGDNVVLNGNVTANSHGANAAEPGGVTKSYIGIFGGTNSAGDGNVTIEGDLVATARSATNGTSDATIEIRAWDDVIFGVGAAMPLADGDDGQVHVESFESAEDINPAGDVARIIIETSPLEALPDFAETHMGSPLAGNVLDNDVDAQGNPITAALDGGPGHAASFTLNPDGSYSYTPQAGYVGDDTFTYTATADGDTTAPILVTITMTNTLPVLSNDAVTTNENTKVGGNVLANDVDANGDPLTVGLVSGPANADSFTLNQDGSFSYTPADGFVGEDSFTYSASDPEIGATPSQATVKIMVNEFDVTAPPAAPGVDVRVVPDVEGYSALTKWVAEEIGANVDMVDVRFVNALASARDIPPYEAFSRFKKAAKVLQDRKGLHADALAKVLGEIASSTTPPTEEQMAAIAEAMARNAETDNVYARTGIYLDSLAEYVIFLQNEIGFSEEEAVEYVTAKYVEPLAERKGAGLAAYVAVSLAKLYEDNID